MIKKFIQNNKWWTASILIILVISAYFIFGNKKTIILDTFTVEKHNLFEEVSTVGNVKPISDLDLSFESGGQVSRVSVSIGDKVFKGQFLASLSNADLSAALEQAKAGLKIAQANLASLQNGSTPEQIAVNESQVEKAKSDLLEAKYGLIDAIQNAYTKSDDAIRNYTDIMFLNSRGSNPTLLFQTDFQLQNDIVTDRALIETLMASWNISPAVLNINSDFNSVVNIASDNLNVIQTFLQNLASAVNKLSTDTSISQTTLTLWKTNVSTARANINITTSNLFSEIGQYQSALYSLNISNSQLTLVKTGATSDQIKAQEATVEQAQANVDAAQARLTKSMIFSPISGVITNVDAKVGQTMQSGITAISVISYGEYEVESYVPEADIAKIKIGNIATTTLDAYGSDTFFETSVVKIDPGETVIENVPTYKVTLKFASSSDNRIKSGMTANLDISTAQKSGVIAVPSRAIYSVDSIKYVQLIDSNNNKTIETKITIGLRSIDGYVEVVSGLKEGDIILSSPNL